MGQHFSIALVLGPGRDDSCSAMKALLDVRWALVSRRYWKRVAVWRGQRLALGYWQDVNASPKLESHKYGRIGSWKSKDRWNIPPGTCKYYVDHCIVLAMRQTSKDPCCQVAAKQGGIRAVVVLT